jgi:S-formylglutathione hydrolase FrmB
VLLIACLPVSPAWAGDKHKEKSSLERTNQHLRGTVEDYTHNHGKDNRIWSRALFERRDLYVYLPPGYNPYQHYPLMLWLHGFAQDEKSFLTEVVPLLDQAMVEGKLPPIIVAAPDGSLTGEPSLWFGGSFFLNSMAGAYEDYLLEDVWDFVVTKYRVLSDRGAHILAGASMGGFGAFNLGIKHRECFGIVIGVFPPVNLRWVNKKGRYFGNFDPKNWGWRTTVEQGHEVIARFYGGVVTIRLKQVIDPLFGRDGEALAQVSRENPIEMIDRLHLREGQLHMYIAYGGKDQFNIDAQVESFLYLCCCRGISVGVGYEPRGRHDYATAAKLFPGMVDWLAPLLAPYCPVGTGEGPGCECTAP